MTHASRRATRVTAAAAITVIAWATGRAAAQAIAPAIAAVSGQEVAVSDPRGRGVARVLSRAP